MEEEAVISFDGDDDDDEFAELFSFATAPSESQSSVNESPIKPTTTDYKDVMASVMPLPPSGDDDESSQSEDSFMEFLEQQKDPVTVLDAASLKNKPTSHCAHDEEWDDKNMQELLDWLDHDEERGAARRLEEGTADIEPPSKGPPPSERAPSPAEETEPEPQFENLEEAVKSPKSSLAQIRRLLQSDAFQVSAMIRPYLWCRVVCGKTLDETLKSSMADSFQQWEQRNQSLLQGKDILEDADSSSGEGTAATSNTTEELKSKRKDKDPDEAVDSTKETSSQPWAEDTRESPSAAPPAEEQSSKEKKSTVKALTPYQKAQREWIENQSKVLSDRIVMVLGGEKAQSQEALTSLLLNHYHTGQKPNSGEDPIPTEEHKDDEAQKLAVSAPEYQDPLLPPVACAILAAGIPKSAAAVVLAQIVPHFMPILALTTKEREHAAHTMHRQLYLLACYHLPSLVLHLDRYIPNWSLWSNSTMGKGEGPGFMPQSYLISHLAGECAVSTDDNTNSRIFMTNPRWILALWDLILSSSNNSLRFFLVVAVLESHAEQLVLLTGDALSKRLLQVLYFEQEDSSGVCAIQDFESQTSSEEATKWVQEWTDKAQKLWEHTPLSISRRLKRIEDQAVTEALTKRQEEAEQRLQRKLEAQATAHQEAMQADRERRADEARLRLTRARLVAFYRQHNPGKETNIDKIMESYQGRFEMLDAKLKQKYGVGFNPALKPKTAPPRNPNTKTGNTYSAGKNKEGKDDVIEKDLAEERKRNQVVAKVAPSEVLPILCWSKKANKARLAKLKKGNKLEDNEETRLPLKFFLVDSRPIETTRDQGRFPTAVGFPPEDLTDPDRLRHQEEMFEALRAASHIVIMGEGFAALPGLYGHKVTAGLAECIREDDGRNNNCALFFLKKGFPFVSILDGGFAAAHAFLCREGKNHHLRVNDVLADYNPDVSIFGQFERVRNSTGREKAQRALQNIFDSSMVALTKNSRRFETLASEAGEDKKKGNIVSRFFAGGAQDASKKNENSIATGQNNEAPTPEGDNKVPTTGPIFRNPFARKTQAHLSTSAAKKLSRENSNASIDVESVDDLDADSSGHKPAVDNDGPTKPATPTRQGSNTLSVNRPKPQAARMKPKTTEPKKKQEPSKSNPFSGFGAVFKSASKAATGDGANSSNKGRGINPFARFNQPGRNLDKSQHGMANSRHGDGLDGPQHGIGSSQHGKKVENQGPGINFAGFNEFRKNTFNIMRNTGGSMPNDSTKASENDNVTEESVAFDQTSSIVASERETEHESALEASDSTSEARIASIDDTPSTADERASKAASIERI